MLTTSTKCYQSVSVSSRRVIDIYFITFRVCCQFKNAEASQHKLDRWTKCAYLQNPLLLQHTHTHTLTPHTQSTGPPCWLCRRHFIEHLLLSCGSIFKPTCTINDAILAFVEAAGGGPHPAAAAAAWRAPRAGEGHGLDQGLYCRLTEGLYDWESLNEVEQVNILTRVSIVEPYVSVVLFWGEVRRKETAEV